MKKMNIALEQQAMADYKELQKIVNENQDLTLKELYDKLGGYNYDTDFNSFDVSYKSICTSIRFYDDEFVLDSIIEIWADKKCYLYDVNFKIELA